MSARARASLRLSATTGLKPDHVVELIKDASRIVKGGGASLLTSGFQNVGAEVHVEREQDGRLELSITSAKRILELCTFSASVTREGSATAVRVGGLERYKTSQTRALGFIPVGPASIAGMAPYKRFLDEIASAIREADPSGSVSISEATA